MPLKNTEYNAVMREYSRLNAESARALEERKRTVYGKHPALLNLQNAIVESAADRARALITGRTGEAALLAEKSDALRRERDRYLAEHHIPPETFELHCSCPDCRDTGFIDGKKCHCFLQRAVNLLYDQSNIRDILQKENFDNLTLDYYNKEEVPGSVSQYEYMRSKIALCHDYVDFFDDGPDSLLFYGPTGTGKTFLTHCIAKALIDSCHSVIYFSAIDLFDQFSKSSFSYDDDAREQLDQYILESDLLIIDDLGTENGNAFTNAKLFYCINERLNRGKSTIISTNLDPNALANTYTERISSRILSSFELIELKGADIRLKKKFNL